jgi:LCP family protein required for cell wall assembly
MIARTGDGDMRAYRMAGTKRPRSAQRSSKAENDREVPPPIKPTKHRSPMWAKLSLSVGAVIAVVSAAVVIIPQVLVSQAAGAIPTQTIIDQEDRGENIDGPINILLLGPDGRSSQKDLGRADSIILVHVPASHDRAFMISIPRDTKVTIPPYPPGAYSGGVDRVNAAFYYGARDASGRSIMTDQGRQQGAALTVKTINKLVPGGLKFNALAIVNFDGFKKILDALGGITMCVDEETHSIHYDKQGVYHTQELPYDQGKVYKKDCYHMSAKDALDFSRQRHFDDGGDYVRQRHQQQLLMAIFKQMLSKGTITNVSKVQALEKAAGDLLTLDLGDTRMIDWLWSLKSVTPNDVVMIKTNNGEFNSSDGYQLLSDDSMKLLKSVHDDNVEQFLVTHPTWIAKAK